MADETDRKFGSTEKDSLLVHGATNGRGWTIASQIEARLRQQRAKHQASGETGQRVIERQKKQ